MDKILEDLSNRIGGFDFWVCTFPGIIMLIIIRTIVEFGYSIINLSIANGGVLMDISSIMSRFKVYYPKSIYSWIAFLFIAYVFGIILQEMSYCLKKKYINSKGSPEELLLSDNHEVITEYEYKQLVPIFNNIDSTIPVGSQNNNTESKTDEKKQSKYVFKCMNAALEKKNITKKYAKLNMIYNYSLSLASGLILTTIVSILFLIVALYNSSNCSNIIIFLLEVLGSGFFARIFILRAKRFQYYWVRNIIFAYEADIKNESLAGESE